MNKILNTLLITVLATAAGMAVTHHTDYAILGIIAYLSMLQFKYEDK